jgi:hypothetical protein
MAAGKRFLDPENVLTQSAAGLRAGLRDCERLLAAEAAARLQLQQEAASITAEINRVRSQVELLGEAEPPPAVPLPKLEKHLDGLGSRIERSRLAQKELRDAAARFTGLARPLLGEADRLRTVWQQACEATAAELLAREQERIADVLAGPCPPASEEAERRRAAAFDELHARVRRGQGNPTWLSVLRGGRRKAADGEEPYVSFLAALRGWLVRARALQREMARHAARATRSRIRRR